MIKYSAGYSGTNNNFVIQNINCNINKKIDKQYLSGLFVIKNILQRGAPTKISKYLAKVLNVKVEDNKLPEVNLSFLPLISQEKPNRERIIRGDIKKNNFPAVDFFNKIPEYLGSEYGYIQQLICPEVKLNDITKIDVEDFQEQQVDFYLPQAFLVIEIDGQNPSGEGHGTNDKERDDYLNKYSIKVVRINTHDMYENNEEFVSKIKEIKDRIDIFNNRIQEKYGDQTLLLLSEYSKKHKDGYNFKDNRLILTAIIRFQMLIISLIECGYLSFDKKWDLNIVLQENLNSDFIEYAIEDLFLRLENIYKLQNIEFIKPKYKYKIVDKEGFSKEKQTVNIDFSILKRYTDEYQTSKDIIFVRNDYMDYYMFFEGDIKNPKYKDFLPYDYFQLSTTTPFTYKIDEKNKKYLEFFLENLTGYSSFNDGQYPIIQNILERKDTIGLLPTGGGKSLCFHMACLLQPASNFVVCPIKSLMYDQVQELKGFGIDKIACITSDLQQKEKEFVQINFSKLKYLMVFISPERFQTKKFREYISNIKNIAYAVIDEMHCLSEWGHDFRTSYLCLAKTIRNYCPGVNFLGLTATASANVLKDIKNELSIVDDESVKTLTEFNRPELEFIVVDDLGDKYKSLVEEYNKIEEKEDVAGIIFTPYVNGDKGCYGLANKLLKKLEIDVRWYSGSCPQNKIYNGDKRHKEPIMDSELFDKYKKEVQEDFKNNKFSLLTATKAFGMGINKKNIAYTFHYGIPTSMEALYQEGGRAGRDKKRFTKNSKAKCFVLLGKEKDDEELDLVFSPETIFENIVHEVDNKFKKKDGKDVFVQLFLWKNGLSSIDDETKNILDMYKILKENGNDEQIIEGKSVNRSEESSNFDIEKTLYRLMLLGVVEDYTISPGIWKSKFEVIYNNIDEEKIKENLESYILKYDSLGINNSRYKEILEKDIPIIEKYIRILLQWSYDHHAYSRRQSLKNLYLDCIRVTNGEISNEDFKKNLESYFRFDNDTYIIQDIADNVDKNIDKRISVFYKTKDISLDDGTIIKERTDEFIGEAGLNSLKSMLGRFLESYQSNMGLNLISGTLRLFLNEYEDLDGKNRLENALEQLKNKDKEIQEKVFQEILDTGKYLNDNQKDLLAESLLKFYGERVIDIYNKLNDRFSLNEHLNRSNNQLLFSYNKLYDKFKTIR